MSAIAEASTKENTADKKTQVAYTQEMELFLVDTALLRNLNRQPYGKGNAAAMAVFEDVARNFLFKNVIQELTVLKVCRINTTT